jgi:hypothetical protein
MTTIAGRAADESRSRRKTPRGVVSCTGAHLGLARDTLVLHDNAQLGPSCSLLRHVSAGMLEFGFA